MMKFESGYSVETVFDGSKLGIEPYSVEVMSSGELLILDSVNSNLYKISSSLSQCKFFFPFGFSFSYFLLILFSYVDSLSETTSLPSQGTLCMLFLASLVN